MRINLIQLYFLQGINNQNTHGTQNLNSQGINGSMKKWAHELNELISKD
jgi:hypothetical protein